MLALGSFGLPVAGLGVIASNWVVQRLDSPHQQVGFLMPNNGSLDVLLVQATTSFTVQLSSDDCSHGIMIYDSLAC